MPQNYVKDVSGFHNNMNIFNTDFFFLEHQIDFWSIKTGEGLMAAEKFSFVIAEMNHIL